MRRTGIVVFLVALVVVIVVGAPEQVLSRNKRLTAFGKTPVNSSPAPASGRGRECKSDRDCDAIVYTSCSTDPRDNRKRCICKDGSHPVNGQCVNRPRERRGYVPVGGRRPSSGLRESCTRDADCLEGAECKRNVNATQSQQRGLVCLCVEGRIEMNNECSGAGQIAQSGTILALLYLVSCLYRNNY